MEAILISLHSIFRWLVLVALLYAIIQAFFDYQFGRTFSTYIHKVCQWTVSIVHIQLIIGMILYIKSPFSSYFWKGGIDGIAHKDILFFGFIHPLLMLAAVVLITIGSALMKRQRVDQQKYKTILLWFSLGFVLIFLAIPWPFSVFAQRSYIHLF